MGNSPIKIARAISGAQDSAMVCCFARLLERTGRPGDGFDDLRDLEWEGEADGEFEGL